MTRPVSSLDSAPDRVQGHQVLLRAGRLRLLVPQADVLSATYLSARPQATSHPGWLQVCEAGAPAQPAVALSRHMALLDTCPDDRFLCTRWSNVPQDWLWIWSEVRVILNADWPVHPLPAVVLGPHTPVRQYVRMNGEITYVASARGLFPFVAAQLPPEVVHRAAVLPFSGPSPAARGPAVGEAGGDTPWLQGAFA